MSKDKKGVIINILSDLSVISPDQRIYQKNNKKINNKFAKPITYSAIKTGMLGLTRYIATYWAHKGIRCNAISPGGIYDNQDKFFVRKLSLFIASTAKLPVLKIFLDFTPRLIKTFFESLLVTKCKSAIFEIECLKLLSRDPKVISPPAICTIGFLRI